LVRFGGVAIGSLRVDREAHVTVAWTAAMTRPSAVG
jgi:hypothetical protein